MRLLPHLPAVLLLMPVALAAQGTGLHLIPLPREVRPGAVQALAGGVRITCTACFSSTDDNFTAQDLTTTLAERGISTSGTYTVQLTENSSVPMAPEAHDEGYTITPGVNSITLAAATPAGLFYAAQTLKQMITGAGSAAMLSTATIRDWPAMRYRGLHDDLSRGPVPTLAFQKHLIEQLAAYKVNVYSPYFEETQQYASNPLPAVPGGSISVDEAKQLTAFAARFHITVIPEQEAFGHLRHTLIWEQYQPLAETPHGAVLTPTMPGSLTLIQQWFGELAQMYPGPFLHIGADETIDLGTGQTKAEVDAQGLAPVYLNFLEQIVAALQPLHRKILFWGDVAQSAPALLKAAPASFKSQTIAVAWGYSPSPKGFSTYLKPFLDAGFETWVSPSINNYRQVYPNQQLALEDIQEFTRDGQRMGATGQLNTLWNDDGESLADMNWYGILFGAAAAWQPGESSIPAFQSSFAEAFHGDRSGLLDQAQVELTKAMDLLQTTHVIGATEGSDGLFWVDPWTPDGAKFAAKMRPIASQLRLHAEAAMTDIAKARAAAPAEFRLAGTPTQAEALAYSADANPANAYPSAPTSLREPNAIDAMELGARRIDFLALKFQLSDEILAGYGRAYSASNSTDPKLRKTISRELSDVNGVNGRLQDLIAGYALLRGLFAQTWLRSNRPYALQPVLDRYDQACALWQARADRVRTAQRQYADQKTLPAATSLGLGAP